jgi:hypothetical protein
MFQTGFYCELSRRRPVMSLCMVGAPKVSHFRDFGCKCFILKKGKLDKFEARSSDGVFFGYANHSTAYRVLNLETNKIMETCEVTLDETMPCTSLGFECAGDEEMVEDLFEEEKDEAGDDDGENHAPEAGCVPTTSPTTTKEGGPSTSWTTTVKRTRREKLKLRGR